MASVMETGPIYFDPYKVEIRTDPYPLYKRMRAEAPLYYNEQYDFYALSRIRSEEHTSELQSP